MGLEPISVQLSDFNKLELLREENERLGEELAEVEKGIRDVMLAAHKRQFLMSLAPYYASLKEEAAGEAAKVKEFESRRELIHAASQVVKVQLDQLEATVGAGAPGGQPRAARAPRGSARSSGFESFDDFRQSRG
ncbi:MAG: hypothetical protein ACYTGB_09480 [Planctomycetota bacterium]|jgi:hypothetical protein